MDKVKKVINKFNSMDNSVKISFIMLFIIVLFAIFQTFGWLGDYIKYNRNEKANITSEDINKINNPNNLNKDNNDKIQEQSNTNVSNNTNNSTSNNTNTQISNIPTANQLQTVLPTAIIFTSEGLSQDEHYKQISEKIKWLENTYKGKLIVRKMTQELNENEMEKYNIEFFPMTVILNTKGEEVGRFEGDWSEHEERIVNKLNELGIQ